jgi:uncharacterized LabA/DUF88 family protein
LAVSWKTYLDRLGPQGLRVTLRGLLADDELRRLLGREVDALPSNEIALLAVDRVAEDAELGNSILERMDAACSAEDSGFEEEDLHEKLAEMLRDPSLDSAQRIHQLARRSNIPFEDGELRSALDLVAGALFHEEQSAKPRYVAKVASDRTGSEDLLRDNRELEARVRQLETQLARALDRAASLEARVSERTAENRALKQAERQERDTRQRLEREIEKLSARIEKLNERRAQERTGEVTTALRRLTTEQRKNASALEKVRGTVKDISGDKREQTRTLDTLQGAIESLLAARDAESRATAAAQQEILRELSGIRRSLGEDAESRRPSPSSNERDKEDSLPRVGVFVDVQNVFYAAREKNARLDFEALLDHVSNNRQLVRAVAYVVEAPESDQSAFIHLLQMKAYEVKRKPLRVRPDRTAKGNWDLEMALDALTTSEQLDIVALVTGDGDFVPLVRELKLKGRRVEVYGFKGSTAPDLREAADRFYPVTRRLLRPLKARRSSTRSTR